MDDFLKKIKGILSGSANLNFETPKEIEESESEQTSEFVSQFMNQLLSSTWVEEELKSSITPSYRLSRKEKKYWLLNIQNKTFTSVSGGAEVTPIELGEKNSTCLIGHCAFSVPTDLLEYTGWN